jgi:hypothetical protein
MRWPWQAKAPTAVYELNDEQVERWREGDQSVWNEDAKGRPLSFNALVERQRNEEREEREFQADDREAGQ